ncbi:MAG: hypothetical protein K2X27_19340 [Candidatus Obscuribacterales bacterium]|nr:hypothetical protein [Candidatus Obscuribacterales bacterium]
MPSLREIEKTLCTLWMNKEARDWLRSDSAKKKLPKVLSDVDPRLLEEVDRAGAIVYAGSINYEHHKMADRIFPYCAKILKDDWDDLVDAYYKRYPSSHFNFSKICNQFSRFLLEDCPQLLAKYPYLAELADYEWLELEKIEHEAKIVKEDSPPIDSLEKIIAYYPVLNPTLTLRYYRYPIAEIAEKLQNQKRPRKKYAESECIMAIYRDPKTHNARFMEIGNAVAALIAGAEKADCSYQDLLKITISKIPGLAPEEAVLKFLELVEELHQDNIFIASRQNKISH